MSRIAGRLSKIRRAIDAALVRSADPARNVTIVAVTKGHPAATVEEVAALGLVDIGENRVAEALEKAATVRADVSWHLIGHLQRNKVANALRLFTTIHSVDNPRLVEVLGSRGAAVDIFLQVNVSGESTKSGARPEAALELLRSALKHPSLRVRGLMTMAPYADDAEQARPVFRALRELRDELDRLGDGPPLRHLSMGMSGDFGVAVEEGATHLRLGTALVGQKPDAAG